MENIFLSSATANSYIPNNKLVQIEIFGWNSFKTWIRNYEVTYRGKKEKPKIVIYFRGSNGIDGQSWDENCQITDDVLKACIRKYKPKNQTLLIVSVGGKYEWEQGSGNPFRRERKLKLKEMPTLLVWNTAKRLESIQETQDMDSLNTLFLY